MAFLLLQPLFQVGNGLLELRSRHRAARMFLLALGLIVNAAAQATCTLGTEVAAVKTKLPSAYQHCPSTYTLKNLLLANCGKKRQTTLTISPSIGLGTASVIYCSREGDTTVIFSYDKVQGRENRLKDCHLHPSAGSV